MRLQCQCQVQRWCLRIFMDNMYIYMHILICEKLFSKTHSKPFFLSLFCSWMAFIVFWKRAHVQLSYSLSIAAHLIKNLYKINFTCFCFHFKYRQRQPFQIKGTSNLSKVSYNGQTNIFIWKNMVPTQKQSDYTKR